MADHTGEFVSSTHLRETYSIEICQLYYNLIKVCIPKLWKKTLRNKTKNNPQDSSYLEKAYFQKVYLTWQQSQQ